MDIGSSWQRLRSSFNNSVGTIVFGMEDGTVSIFGLIFGVAATTTDTKTVLIAGASGAAAAAVSMMAGAYLDARPRATRPTRPVRPCWPRPIPGCRFRAI
jgi:vacuolar iron transporter family protein